jgi:2-polyprenyl-3-methyl-5-hydroxy-6-metoxy-1,4-benzoquinol methylase
LSSRHEMIAMAIASYEEQLSNAKYTVGCEIERTSKVFARGMIPADRALRILDVGCGSGLNARMLAQHGHTVVGIDLSPVAIAKFRATGFEGHVCDVTQGIAYPDESFDIVFASEVIEHVVDTDRFLAELNRVLKRGGTLVLTTPNSAFWVYRLFSLLGRPLSDVQHRGHVRFFSKASLVRALTGQGFSPVALSARHMYLIVGDRAGRALSFLPRPFALQRELRFRTKSYFWHLSRFARSASAFWADTFIAVATKPSALRA